MEGQDMRTEKIKKEILARLENPVMPGGLKTYYNVCGKAICRCKRGESPKLHGPYTHLSYSIEGESSTLSVSEKDTDAAVKAIENFKNLKSLLNKLALNHVAVARREGMTAARSKASSTRRQEASFKPESAVVRTLRESRDKWKARALERKKSLSRGDIKIRDMEKSRNEWKKKYFELVTEKKALQNQVEKRERELVVAKARLADKKKD